MSLRDFIRATAKDIQDAATKNAAPSEQPPLQRTGLEARVAGTGIGEEEETEKEGPSLSRKKTKRGERTEME